MRQGAWVRERQEAPRDALQMWRLMPRGAYLLARREQSPDRRAKVDAWVVWQPLILARQALQFQAAERLLAQADARRWAPQLAERPASLEPLAGQT